jgi:hypothetical protein
MLTHENSVLAKISRVIGSSLEIDDVYTRFAEEVQNSYRSIASSLGR